MPTVSRSRRRTLALPTALLVLAAPAPASANVFDSYERLNERRLRPTPLVLTTAPPALSPLDTTLEVLRSPRRSGYGFRLAGDDAVIAFAAGAYPTMRSALRDFRGRLGFRARSTRVRNRRGYLMTRSSERTLLWAEGGRVYWLGTGTPRSVSLNQLHATARGLDPLQGVFSGSDSLGEQEARFVATRRTVTGDLAWTARCTAPDSSEASQRAGQAFVTLHPKSGSDFSFDLAPNLGGSNPAPWQGTVSGTVGANGGTVNLRATTTVGTDSCDTGPVSFAVRPQR